MKVAGDTTLYRHRHRLFLHAVLRPSSGIAHRQNILTRIYLYGKPLDKYALTIEETRL